MNADPSPLNSPWGYILVTDNPVTGEPAFSTYSRDSAASVRNYNDTGAVTNMKRARDIVRRYHDWEVPSDEELRQAAMEGRR